jgi:hypothetical protein
MLKTVCLLLLFPAVVCAKTVIPEEITVPTSDDFNLLSLHANGQQIYQCVSHKGEYSWQLQAPNAQLFDTKGHAVGSHSAGPEWHYQDGSRVLGRVLKKVDMNPDSAIAWVLLEAIEHHGAGVFANTRFIQRINTHGGLPPVSACNSNHLGAEKPTAYSADYIFYTR